MSKINKLINQLVDLSERIQIIEERGLPREIYFSDLNVFYSFSLLNISDFEKVILNSLSSYTLDKHLVILKKIKTKLQHFIDFYENNSNFLDSLIIEEFLDDKLAHLSFQIKSYASKLKPISKEFAELEDSIEASSYNRSERRTKLLLQKRIVLKKELDVVRNKYHQLHDKKRQEIEEYSKYLRINFREIKETFKSVLIIIEKDVRPVKKLENEYLSYIICYNIHETFEDDFFKNITIDELYYLLNLKDQILEYKIPYKESTRFYYLIDRIWACAVLKSKDTWKDLIIEKLKISPKAYRSNYKNAISVKQSKKDKPFLKKINSIFKES